jgi:hypothetical protein
MKYKLDIAGYPYMLSIYNYHPVTGNVRVCGYWLNFLEILGVRRNGFWWDNMARLLEKYSAIYIGRLGEPPDHIRFKTESDRTFFLLRFS